MNYLAHVREDGTEQDLIVHLKNTAEIAKKFAEDFNNSDYAYLCGLFHDIGKYSEAFQKRIRNDGKRCDHSTAGARVVKDLSRFGKILSFCITGHHGGLLNHGTYSDIDRERTLCSRLSKDYKIPNFDAFMKEIEIEDLRYDTPPNLKIYDSNDFGMTFYMFIKMLHSCLTDADYLDTEAFMYNGNINRTVNYDFEEMLDKLNLCLKHLQKNDGIINVKRQEILQDCIEKAYLPRGLYTLTVPTGGGKTLSSMAFSLNHLIKNQMNRIIYVIPYTNIIEQTAKVFSDIFVPDVILEHHSNYDFNSEDDDFYNVKKLASQNWDMPIVITTNVQFFESIYSNKTTRSRKLHNITNSLIIFDEAQMLPLEYIKACTKAISELVINYNCTAVLCTATQPSLTNMFPREIRPIEICKNTKELYELFKRTTIINRGLLTTKELANEMNELYQCLTIVNTRRHAKSLFSMLKGEGVFHLSTLMCPEHRKQVIDEIRMRLRENKPCKVVSTRLIEAGVDVDFPRVYRAFAGLDSIIQSAGRGNREGKLRDKNGNLTQGEIHIFEADDEYTKNQPLNFKAPIEITKKIIRDYKDITSPEAIESYFDKLYFYNGEESLDNKDIIKRINEACPKKVKSFDEAFTYPFEDIARDFKLMEENTVSVIIPFDCLAVRKINELRYVDFIGEILKSLQGYTVNIYEREYNNLYGAGKIELVQKDIAVLRSMEDYSEEMGINIEIKSGVGLFY